MVESRPRVFARLLARPLPLALARPRPALSALPSRAAGSRLASRLLQGDFFCPSPSSPLSLPFPLFSLARRPWPSGPFKTVQSRTGRPLLASPFAPASFLAPLAPATMDAASLLTNSLSPGQSTPFARLCSRPRPACSPPGWLPLPRRRCGHPSARDGAAREVRQRELCWSTPRLPRASLVRSPSSLARLF